ncbi:MAG: carboxypeptidase regulatory-like domain-containing protein [FCB group bacterium]|nr:carboxypeptidase regulatory-like domain-containing protein [FCB group bacterium]
MSTHSSTGKRCILFLSLVLLAGCTQDAPRDNPFDPENSLYRYAGEISGLVTRRYAPYEPMDSVRVELLPDALTGYTDAQGAFRFRDLSPGIRTLLLSKPGYAQLTDTMTVASRKISDALFRLNGKPTIDSLRLTTRHIAHWWPIEHEYLLSVDVWVNDRDGVSDVDSVDLTIPELPFGIGLSRENADGKYSITIFDSDFLPASFSELPGRNILFSAVDRAQTISDTVRTQIARIITATPATLSPGNQDVVDAQPWFRWSSFDVGYSITYSVAIFRLDDSGIPQFVQGSESLSIATLEWQVSDSLAPALYYWTLTVTDRFGNSSSSKEATFIVQ